MGKLFNLDNPVMQFLSRVFDLMLVNIMTAVFFVPVALIFFNLGVFPNDVIRLVMLFVSALLIGPALTAMHYMCLKMLRNEESYIIKGYFKSFRENFVQALRLWAVFELVFGAMIYDFFLIRSGAQALSAFTVVLFVAGFLLFGVFLWTFPLLARYVNTDGRTLRNAVILMLGKLPRTLGMMGLFLLPWVILYFTGNTMIPIMLMLGISLPAYGMAALYNPVFKKLEPEEEETGDPDAMPEALRDEPVDTAEDFAAAQLAARELAENAAAGEDAPEQTSGGIKGANADAAEEPAPGASPED